MTASPEEIKARGLWLKIPLIGEIPDAARAAGAVYGGIEHDQQWAMPDEQTYAEISAMAEQWRRHLAAEARRKHDERAAAITAERRRAIEEEEREQERIDNLDPDAAERVIAESDRTPTGETAELTAVTTRTMTDRDARLRARTLGDVVKLADGRRGIITRVRIWHTDEDIAASVCWHSQTQYDAHWDFRYDVAIVEPTAREAAADARRRNR